MPRPTYKGELDDFKAPTMIVAAKIDILFPASRIIPRAKEIFPNLIYVEMIEGQNRYFHLYIFVQKPLWNLYLLDELLIYLSETD